MKSGKRHLTDGMELQHQNNVRTLKKGNIQILMHLGGWYNQTNGDDRKKLIKNISEEPESYSRQNYVPETLAKE